MKKIKPVVIGYRQMSYRGVSISSHLNYAVYSKREMAEISKAERIRGRIKSKFRPVYKKDIS